MAALRSHIGTVALHGGTADRFPLEAGAPPDYMSTHGMIATMPSEAKLSRAALAFRVVHAAVAAGFLFAIGYVWWCALTGRRDALLRVAVSGLIGEDVLVIANGGDCPFGGLQERVGDPVPLFELLLSPQAARRAVPVLGTVAAVGIGLLRLGSTRPRPAP